MKDKLDRFAQMEARIQELEQERVNSQAAMQFMSNMVDSGVVEQTGRDSIVVHSNSGDKQFRLNGDDMNDEKQN